MSTSLLVTKMREAAAAKGYEAEIDAFAVADAANHKDADVVLIGPQVRFQLKKLQSQFSCPVEPIEMQAYGTMDGAAVIAQARKALGD